LLKVYQVAEVARQHRIPIIGQGGICSAHDAIEFLLAGATAVGVGTALFYDPLVCKEINAGIATYLEKSGFASVSELTGALNEKHPHPNPLPSRERGNSSITDHPSPIL
jgi:dihydroorotate dehydrogenase (NAD+) catalytic subunit